MSHQILSDEELRSSLHEARSYLAGLVAECNARHWLIEATLLGNAEIVVLEVSQQVLARSLPAWKFVKPDGSVGVCAWCQGEQGQPPAPGESHGICPKHLDEQRARLRSQQLAGRVRIPVDFTEAAA